MNDTITYEDIKDNLRSCRKALVSNEYSFKDLSDRTALYNTLVTAEYALQTLIQLRDAIEEVNNNES